MLHLFVLLQWLLGLSVLGHLKVHCLHQQNLYRDKYRLLTGWIYIDYNYPCWVLSIVIIIDIYPVNNQTMIIDSKYNRYISKINQTITIDNDNHRFISI